MVGIVQKTDTRERILKVAENIFASKGFDAARVDGIAKEAGVNKALIYYYFDSKDSILQELFDRFFTDSARQLLRFIQKGGLEFQTGPEAEALNDEFLSFYEARKDLLRVIFIESLKRDTTDPPLFKLVDLDPAMFEKMVPDYGQLLSTLAERGLPAEGENDYYLLVEFFTNIIPTIAFILFRDQWGAHFKLPGNIVRDYFLKANDETHMSYHRNRAAEMAGNGAGENVVNPHMTGEERS